MQKALTWDELATIYDRITGRKARIQPMHTIAEWAGTRPDLFAIDPKKHTIHLLEREQA